MNKKIKVLRIIARLNIGGPSIHVALLTHWLDPNRFTSTLVTGKVSPQEGDMSYILDGLGIKVIMIPELQRNLNFLKDTIALFKVLKILSQEKPDIVHTHTAKAGTIGRIASFIYNCVYGKKIRVVHTFHGHVFQGYFRKQWSRIFIWAECLLAKISDVIIAISKSQKRELSNIYGIAPINKFRVVKLGFELDPFLQARTLKGRFRRSLGVDGKTILVGIIGRLVSIKNHVMFLKSARVFLNQNPYLSVRFIIIGDGELRSELESYCERQGLSNYVKFLCWMRSLEEIYADLDIVALTSINEGTPVSLIEAMASLVPVISTDVGGVRDLLGDPVQDISTKGFRIHERGIIVSRQGDADSFAAGLKYLIEHRDNLKEMSLSARSFVSRNHSKRNLLRETEQIYIDLMKGVHTERPFLAVEDPMGIKRYRYKVLQVYKDYYPPVFGGMEKHINILSQGLVAKGIQNEVLVSNTKPKAEVYYDNSIKIVKVPEYGRLQSAPLTPNFWYYLRIHGKDADIIHFHFPNPTAELSFILSQLGKPYVVTYQSDIHRQKTLLKLYTPFMRYFLNGAETIITSSLNYMTTSKVLKRYKEKSVVIPLGIDFERYQHLKDISEEVSEIRKKYGDRIVLFVGRMRYYKGIQYLIRAMQKVDAKLLIVGEGDPVEAEVKELVRMLSLQDKLDFLGTVDDETKDALLHACDLLVLPSIYRSEAFGLILLEAMACGKPVISTELGTGTSFINLHEETGLVVPPRETDELAKAINTLLEDRNLREKYGKAGRERVQAHFSVETMVDRVIDLYTAILNGTK